MSMKVIDVKPISRRERKSPKPVTPSCTSVH
jgi:hypothetical protein